MWSDKQSDDSVDVFLNPREKYWSPFQPIRQPRPQNIYKEHQIDLATFKTLRCTSQDPKHNKKHCPNYHNENDRRRNTYEFKYKCDFCPQGRNCPLGDDCDLSHNKVEQLYHPDRYKTKYCQSKQEDCEYGVYCTFAHTDEEINIPLKLHLIKQDQEFWLFCYKTVWCPYIENHERGQCVYAHNAQDFRRDPSQFHYHPQNCPNWNKSQQVTTYELGGCEQKMSCKLCHGWKELDYHPSLYKTKKCSQGINCPKRDCAFYHNDSDKRKNEDQQQTRHLIKPYSNFNGPIIPKMSAGQQHQKKEGLLKKKLTLGQPFEVFSSKTLTAHTSTGSRKMSDTSYESKSIQNDVSTSFKQQPKPLNRQERKNYSAPATPEQSQFQTIKEYMQELSINHKPLLYSDQFNNLIQKYEAPQIFTILQNHGLTEEEIMLKSEEQLNRIFQSKKLVSIIRLIIQELKQDLEDLIQRIQE